ncbi:MAG TPA: palindromic element RPE3 domain-containing protein [Rickettsia endosymbiont of Pyrocoelia pectoralis]|nr:palindromic element RPE3 domain-containing protein [Rickettsia endosymbiont of Pyrocoelia pectoralis]
MEKSKEFVSREAERTIVREHSRSYKNDVQLNSKSFRQDEFKGEPAERTLST